MLFRHANQFKVNQKKCMLGCSTVEYLVHVVSGHGVEIDPNKVSLVCSNGLYQGTSNR